MTPRITAILFDLGETLWHFPDMPPFEAIREETVRRLNALLESWGVQVNDELLFLGRDIRIAVEEETERAFWGDCLSPDYPALCQQAAADLGLRLTRAQAEALWETWNLGGPFLGRHLFPDVIDTLHWLRQRGYRLGSVTNRGYGGRRFQAELRDLGLAELFEVVAVSCDVGYLKPHPRIFHYALEAMALSPQETAMVGDNLRADIGGAKALGMTAIFRRRRTRLWRGRRPPLNAPMEEPGEDPRTPSPSANSQATPDYVVDNIGDLRRLPLFAGP